MLWRDCEMLPTGSCSRTCLPSVVLWRSDWILFLKINQWTSPLMEIGFTGKWGPSWKISTECTWGLYFASSISFSLLPVCSEGNSVCHTTEFLANSVTPAGTHYLVLQLSVTHAPSHKHHHKHRHTKLHWSSTVSLLYCLCPVWIE